VRDRKVRGKAVIFGAQFDKHSKMKQNMYWQYVQIVIQDAHGGE